MPLPTKPGRPCSICSNAERRKAVDRAILSGEPIARIARRFPDVSSDAIYRHSQKHLSRAQLRAAIDRADAAEEQHQVGLVLDARKLRYKAVQLLLAAERSGDLATAIRGIREARDCLLAEARLSGQLDPPSVNVNVENEAPSVVVVLPANGREPPELIGEAVND
jgi:transposase-like protein